MNAQAAQVEEVKKIGEDLSRNTERLDSVLQRYTSAPDPMIALVEVLINKRAMNDDDDQHS